jgi:hypothetical protein
MELLDTINQYISPIYNQSSKNIISRMPLSEFNKLLNMYLNQNEKKISEYIMFELNKIDNEVILLHNYSTISDENTYQVIYHDPTDITYIFQAISFLELYELIIVNSNRYVFIPITFSYKDSKIGHATLCIIDKLNLSIRFFDSNGLTKGLIDSKIVDKFLETYFDIFNITFNEKYTYIKQNDWINSMNATNNKNYTLNKQDLSNNVIQSGHCMIFTLIIAHLLSQEKYELNKIIVELNKLPKQQLLDFVMGYTERAVENYNLIK